MNDIETTKRRPGRPPRGQEVCTPAMLEKIGRMWCEGMTPYRIGQKLGLDPATIREHLKTKIVPAWRRDLTVTAEAEVAKSYHLEREAWKMFHKTGKAEWLAHVSWAIGFRAKIAGLYAPEKLSADIRVAGQTPEQFTAETIGAILTKIQERRTSRGLLPYENGEN